MQSLSHRAPASRPSAKEALRKYESNPLLHRIKHKYPERTSGLEDVHSCLRALTEWERLELLGRRVTWADICLAELLRIGRARRVLTGNVDGNLLCATATLRTLPALYRRAWPELQDAATPSIYLLGDASPETVGQLVQRGASLSPWIVIGVSGAHFGLAQTLLSVDRFEHGLYWVGHFHEEPLAELRDRLFTPARNAHWISGFDADSFMAYLLRGLGGFPPPGVLAESGKFELDDYIAVFDGRRPDIIRHSKEELQALSRATTAEVHRVLESVAQNDELRHRAGRHLHIPGALAWFANCRAPYEVKPYLIRAANLLETHSLIHVDAPFATVCRKLAQFSCGDTAHSWYARADASFPLMDFGPGSGALVLYGHLDPWAQLLAEWACFEPHQQSHAIWTRAKATYLELLRRCAERAAQAHGLYRPDEILAAVGRVQKSTILHLVRSCHTRARVLPPADALTLLNEAGRYLEALRRFQDLYCELLAQHLFYEAEASPDRRADLLLRADQSFQQALNLPEAKPAEVLQSWAIALGELAARCTGDQARQLFARSALTFRNAESAQPDQSLLHKHWANMLVAHSRRFPGDVELPEKARVQAERANAAEPGQGSYSLACLSAAAGDRQNLVRWLSHSANHGRIPRLSAILADENFSPVRSEPWFRELLQQIFDAEVCP